MRKKKEKTWKVKESDYTFIEDEVTLYPVYKEKIAEIVHDLSYAVPERDNNGGGKSNLPSRPTENIVFNLLDDLQLRRMKKYVQEVERAINELDDEKRRFVEAVFWREGHKTTQSICMEFSISYDTYRRWKQAFLLRVGLLTGDKRSL